MHLAHGQRLEFTELSAEEPLDDEWKTRCRQHIKTCNYVIAILSTHTRGGPGGAVANGVRGRRGKPTLGVHKWADAKGKFPSELAGCKIIEWTWEGIGAFLEDCDERESLESAALSGDCDAVDTLMTVVHECGGTEVCPGHATGFLDRMRVERRRSPCPVSCRIG